MAERRYAADHGTLVSGDVLELLLRPEEDGVARLYNLKGEVWIELMGNIPWTLYTQTPPNNECPDPKLHYRSWAWFRARWWDWLHDRMFGKHGEW